MNFEVHNLGHPNNNNKQANKYMFGKLSLYVIIKNYTFAFKLVHLVMILISVCALVYSKHI